MKNWEYPWDHLRFVRKCFFVLKARRPANRRVVNFKIPIACIAERLRCLDVPLTGVSTTEQAGDSLLLPAGHFYWWTWVSSAHIWLSCLESSFFLCHVSDFSGFFCIFLVARTKHLADELLLRCLWVNRFWSHRCRRPPLLACLMQSPEDRFLMV